MEMYQGSSTQQPAAICALKSPVDAIHILEAVRLGIVPRVTRRLTGHERAMIRPGTVWVWEEEETNMRRWTDGRRWGASRVGGGGFLVYTESSESLSPPPSRSDSPYGQPNGYYPGPSSSRRTESLIKQTYSTTMTHPVTGKLKKFHVVAYSSKHNPQGDAHNPLPLPHQLPALSSLRVTPGIWPEWEHRREQEFGATGRRPPSASGTAFIPPSQSAPVTAVSSPNGPPYSVVVPPTAYPAPSPRPGSPRGDGMFGRPFPPPPYPQNRFDGRASPALPPPQGNLRGPSAPYTPPYPQAPRRDPYDNAAGYPGRHMSVPPMYPNQPAPGSERYHPYGMQSRNANRVTSYPPSTGSSVSSGNPALAVPTTPTEGAAASHHMIDGPSSRDSPSQQYPFAYSRPDSSHGRPIYQDTKPDRLSPEVKYRNQPQLDGNTDPRRYPSGESPMNGGHSRNVSNASRSGADISPNQSSRLQPPANPNDLASASGRSPKMSISSTLLNHQGQGQTQGQGQGHSASSTPANGPGLTLPPLRTTFDERSNGNTIGVGGGGGGSDGVLPSPGRISPGGGAGAGAGAGRKSGSNSPNEIKKDWGKGEDARQLGELGRRVVL
ncbi:uncharacterized protein I303_106400 [Kwoniella dejecticola CBS 10117]|uniref:cAMP-independent regulatory protein pac2 n=1 Tax=Kwoniella dejecticola CBS 10117 TaxID=1296121 RepID=A0A1A5ZUT5_9TREE|nr:uncharacterized protein I303_08341 [Kwoniella dejecticola CBS 10117]OBR81571.1 hypothetical protein I303_08341 [Kwoniella dejecticola CBS 10117]